MIKDFITIMLTKTHFESMEIYRRFSCKAFYHMACVCSQYDVCSDWLILGRYSPVMPTAQLRFCKTKVESHIINNLLTSNVQSLVVNLKPWPCHMTLLSLSQHGKVLVHIFP